MPIAFAFGKDEVTITHKDGETKLPRWLYDVIFSVAGTLPRSLLSQGLEKLGGVNLGKAFSTAARVTAPITTSIRRTLFGL